MKTLIKKLSSIEKSKRIVISCVLMSLLMLISTFFFFDKAIFFIPLFVLLIYILTFFSILEEIEKIEWLMLFLMPVIFTVAAYVFYFLFPVRWLTRLPFIILYTISIYAILRISNIFNVGVEKSLQLYRAAFSVNYFYQTVTVFLLGNFLFSLKMNPFTNGLTVFFISFLLASNLFWTIKLDLTLEKNIIGYGLLIALILSEGIIVISFIAFEISIAALLLTVFYYSLVGLTYAYLDQRFFKETIREYIFVLIFVFGIALLSSIR